MLRTKFQILTNTFLDLLYPRTCVSCGVAPETESHFCGVCRAGVSLHSADGRCALCGKIAADPLALGTVEFVCGQCEHEKPRFDCARSAAAFKGSLRDAILAFKYTKALWLEKELTEFLSGCFLTNYSDIAFDVVCPVPLHRRKLRKRGYNQSELLAARLAKTAALPYSAKLLRRRKNTVTQTRLDAWQRRSNVAGAFETPPEAVPLVYGKTILVIDDVMTTGATLSECAATLKRNGAWRVFALTIARD